MELSLSKKTALFPLASLYLKENDWLLYNHTGYFASSKDGINLIKYQQNQGYDKEARIIDNEQIFQKFYRPDIIQAKLQNISINLPLNVASVVQTIKPPHVEIIDTKESETNNKVIEYKVCDMGSGSTDPVLLINGITISPKYTRGFSIVEKKIPQDSCQYFKNTITLKKGKNKITVQASDASNTISSKSNIVTIENNIDTKTESNLHFISFAVQNYQSDALDLKYTINDAKALQEKFFTKGEKLFKHIYTHELHDANATLTELDNLFTKLSQTINVEDTIVLFISGHGTMSKKDGLYYFYPYDIKDLSSDGLSNQAISVETLKYQLSKISAKNSLILIDTCDSGGAIKNLNEKIIGDRLSKDNNRNFIVASSKSQYALEGYKNHGVFSYAVLGAFENAYFGKQTILTTTSLAGYVESEVPRISREHFGYEQTPQKFLSGSAFEIGIK